MKFSVERDLLFSALSRVRAIIEPRSTIPILSHARLIAKDGKLHVRGSDLDNQTDAIVPADIAIEGGATVSAGYAYDIVKTLPKNAAVAFELGIVDGQMSLKSGRARFKLPSLPINDFPDIEDGKNAFSHSFVLPRKVLEELFDGTRFAICTEETRYYLNGGFFHTIDDEIRVCATDGHRLALVSRSAPEGCRDFPGLIIPTKTINAMLAMSSGKAEIGISLSTSKIRFDFGDGVLLSKVIDGTFPDYQRVIPTGNNKRLVVDREGFLGAVARCAAVSEKNGRAIKLEMSADTGLVIELNAPDHGSSREELDASFDGDGVLSIGFNPRYLTSVAERFDSESLIFILADPGSPAIVAGREGAIDKTIIMPMRV